MTTEIEKTEVKCKLVAAKITGDTNNKCVVCRLDCYHSNDSKGIKRHTVYCKTCDAYVHAHELDVKRAIHHVLPGMSCHEIYKSETGQQIWTRDNSSGARSAKSSHPIIQELRVRLGKSATSTRKKKNESDEED
jgi:hypothetical protein